MTLTKSDIYKQPQTTSGWKDHWTETDNETRQDLASKVADELNLIRKQDVSMQTMKQMLYNLEMMLRGK